MLIYSADGGCLLLQYCCPLHSICIAGKDDTADKMTNQDASKHLGGREGKQQTMQTNTKQAPSFTTWTRYAAYLMSPSECFFTTSSRFDRLMASTFPRLFSCPNLCKKVACCNQQIGHYCQHLAGSRLQAATHAVIQFGCRDWHHFDAAF